MSYKQVPLPMGVDLTDGLGEADEEDLTLKKEDYALLRSKKDPDTLAVFFVNYCTFREVLDTAA